MSKEVAIKFTNVHQIYPLFTNPKEMFAEFLGLNKFLRRENKIQKFQALTNINLTINRGKKIGIIGQNGAGKTTLLKLATGNYLPTLGTVEIYGKVQSLMDSGLGFHQEFTGRENIKSSLMYNGLTPKQTREAIEDIIDFAELGEFIDQPIKTYSLGMVSRLGFATATAIHPEILIIDEIMGAGDAYFASKSSDRMKRLTKEGTTLLLVSHSTAQIIQFCDQAIWIKDRNIHMQGEALEVCKAYTKYMRERDEDRLEQENQKLKEKNTSKRNQEYSLSSYSVQKEETKDLPVVVKEITEEIVVEMQPDNDIIENVIDDAAENGEEENRSIIRWNGSREILIEDFYMLNSLKERCFTFNSKESIDFIMTIKAQKEGFYPCKYVIATYTLAGQPATIHLYNEDCFFKEGQEKTICLSYPELLLGNGDYVVSLAVYKQLDMDNTNNTGLFYDLLDRSFQFKVINQFKDDMTTFIHPATWKIN